MNEEKLIKTISELRSIKPDKNYTQKSRAFILASSKERFNSNFVTFGNIFEFLRLAAVTVFGILLLITIFGGVSYLNKNFSPVLLSGLDQKSLITEANEINDSINVTLKEIKYLDNTSAATDKQINQIADNNNISADIESLSDIESLPTSSSSSFDQQINELLEKASQ